jgi:hypothetical protein
MMSGTYGAIVPRWDLLTQLDYEAEPYQS